MSYPQEPVDTAPLPVAREAHASTMSLIDGCPECIHNTEPPKSAVRAANGWLTAYVCSDCGHAWATSWKD
jgi:hypothetical protein